MHKKIVQLMQTLPLHETPSVLISGLYTQRDLLNLKGTALKVAQEIQAVIANHAISLLREQNVNIPLSPQHLKFITAPRNETLVYGQVAHCDGLTKDVFVVAYYLTKHTSTAFSIHPHQNALGVTTPHDYGSGRHWDDFIEFSCDPGDLSVFRQNVIHKGPSNPSDSDREVLFLVLTPSSSELPRHNDNLPYYPWTLYKDKFGPSSKEYKNTLRKYRRFSPWNHESRLKDRRRVARISTSRPSL
jgi:hypothetical protein